MQTRDKILLVVDDAPDNIQLLGGLLKDKYKIKAATSGEKALEIARKAQQPDLILLDVMMPGMDGYEVCARLKSDESTRGIPVIFVTGHASEVEIQKGLGMGAEAYLSKPVVPDELFSAVERILQSR